MPGPNLDAIAPRGNTKADINYRQYQSCKTCVCFNGRVYCSKVEGHVSPHAVCDLWTLQELTEVMTGKEFMQTEYEKSKGG